MLKILFTSLLFIAISSCSTTSDTPDMHFYLLDDVPSIDSRYSDESVTDTQIQLSAIQLPDYLKQRQLVIKQNSNQLKIANYHSWADDLGDSIQRVLMNNLNAKTDNYRSGYRFSGNCGSCSRVIISIEHFYPTEQGQVVLSGSMQLIDPQGASKARNGFLFTNELAEDGYDNAVSQMRELLGELTLQINELLI